MTISPIVPSLPPIGDGDFTDTSVGDVKMIAGVGARSDLRVAGALARLNAAAVRGIGAMVLGEAGIEISLEEGSGAD